ncbi:FAD-binding oxidoreductase [Candidatus Peregrinibacteria bacterium]|nr:FAD-binding oxidoreductase [Candidatus Peregrinibacteria bacterium]
MLSHEEKIQSIADQLKQLSERPHKGFVSLQRAGVSHKVPNAHEQAADNKILVGKLDQILELDPINKTCTAESGIAFSDLVKETLKHDLVPYTVPELKTITIGGAVSGCSVESMSYKYGGFHDSCLEYELITTKGEILTCSAEKNPEVFHMLHGAFGTLGIITKIKFKLHPAKKYVHLEHVKYTNFPDYQNAIQQEYQNPKYDYMDGIIHSPSHFTLCLGTFTDTAPYTNNYDNGKIFHKSTKTRAEDYLKTHDYFFRYDADCHWISRNYGLENPLIRFLLGRWLLSSSNMIKTAKTLRPIFKHFKPDVIVDIFVAMSRFQEFFEFYLNKFNYFPLWIVPYKIQDRYPWINETFMKDLPDQLFIDCAVYGLRQGKKDYYQIMDEKLLDLQGLKTLISHNKYSPETFWQIYNKPNYQKAKQITDPDNIFKDLYQKTHGHKTT